MMGQLPPAQNELFYDFCLDKFVPQDHLLRSIDSLLDLSELRCHLSSFYSTLGRPSVDPELMIRMLIVGYCFGIRSERRLCEEVHLNLAYRWFCRLGLEAEVPDHSTFSKNRHGRFRDSNAFRYLFETVLQRCMAEGLVRAEGFAADASVIEADAHRLRRLPGDAEIDWGDPEVATRPVREYLAALDDSVSPATPPKHISLTDPAASWTAAPGRAGAFTYSTNYLVDTAYGIIMDVEATPANRSAEVASTRDMIDRVEARFALKPQRLIGDTAYGVAPMLGWLVETKGIAPYVPVWDKTQRDDGTFSSSDFQWDEQADQYRCPAGKTLRSRRRRFSKPRTVITKANNIHYRASQSDCAACPLKPRCCPNAPVRKIVRSVHEASRDVARQIAETPDYRRSCAQRKKVEILFAHLKRIMKLDRLRLRGIDGARDEFLLAATVQNLRRMAKLLSQPPPDRRIRLPA